MLDTKTLEHKGKLNVEKLLYKLVPLLTLLALIILFSILSPFFFTMDNIFSIIVQSSILGMMGLGVTFVIITAGIDLSIGSLIAVAGVVMGLVTVNMGAPLYVGIIAGLLFASLFGAIQGVIIAKLRVTAFVVTLGGMMVARGIGHVATNSNPIYIDSDFLMSISGGYFIGIPIPVIIFLFFALISHILLSYTRFGRYVYAIGSNEVATKLSGINVAKVKILTYALCSFMVGIGSLLMVSRLGSAQPTAGNTYELLAIAAVVIGGTSLFGGVGTILGTVIGTILMGVLRNGLNLLDVNQFWQMIITGGILIFAVYIDGLKTKE